MYAYRGHLCLIHIYPPVFPLLVMVNSMLLQIILMYPLSNLTNLGNIIKRWKRWGQSIFLILLDNCAH